jgi:hypothetical protein
VLQAAGTDVWHAGLSHADVFHPSAAPSGAARVQPIFLAATPPPPTRFDYALEHLNSSYHASYHRLGDINDLVAGLERQAPELVSRVTYGHSFEGRPLEVVHVRNASAQTKASVVVIGSQHAREVSPDYFLRWPGVKLMMMTVDRDRCGDVPPARPGHARERNRIAPISARTPRTYLC